MSVDRVWTSDKIIHFIQKRSKHCLDPTVPLDDFVYVQILDALKLPESVTVQSAAQLWENLVNKYKELSQPSLERYDSAPPTWPYFGAMHEAFLSSSVLGNVTSDGLEVEEEAAHLEEVFRNNNLVAIQQLNEETCDVDENDDDLVILEELLSGEDESDEKDDYDPTDLEDVSSQRENEFAADTIMDEIWNEENIEEFIMLRGNRHVDMMNIGQVPVYREILAELKLSDKVSPLGAHRKWTDLVRKYEELKKDGGSEDPEGNEDPEGIWPFFESMKMVMETIETKDYHNGFKTSRKSPDYSWSLDVTKKFIRLRTEKHAEISLKGHNVVYQEILNTLGICPMVTVPMARKKWNYLLKRYQDEELAGGLRTWAFMKDMKQVMKYFRGCSSSRLKSRASPEFLWPNELTKQFIELRSARHSDFIEGNIQNTYTEIMEELGLEHILTPNHLRKKWNYLVAKFKELSCSAGPDGSIPAPHTWPFYEDMQKGMQRVPENTINSTKIVRVNFENIWTSEILLKFIQLRGTKALDANKKVQSVFSEILEELGLSGQITPYQARKKWNYLYTKYQDLCYPDVGEFSRQSWAYFSAMQKAVGSLPLAQISFKRNSLEDTDVSEEDKRRKISKKVRQFICFICGKSGKVVSDFFMFEQNQHLLHTQKTVMEIICHLLNKKLINVDSSTCLCSSCTNLVNEADAVIHRYEKIIEHTQKLYLSALERSVAEREAEVRGGGGEEVAVSPEILVPERQEELEEENVSYSKRGRKRKATVLMDSVKMSIKREPLEDGLDGIDCDVEFDYDSEDERRRKRARGRGRGRGKKRKGRPVTRTTLIGRGLKGQYPTSNKRKMLPFKGPKIYYCLECKGEFKKYTELISHRKDAHTVIDKSTLEVNETILENGVITYFNKGKANNSDTSHLCKECDKYFLRKDDLSYHHEISHTGGKGRAKTAFKDRSYDCEECGEKFLFKYKLKMHINSKHLNDAGQTANDFTCGQCGCKLGSLPGLTFHMRKHHNKSLTHRKTTEYLCSDCGFLATSSKKLREHQESHCGASFKPKVQCEMCGKTVLKVSLKMHKAKMHSEFKEQCDKCGERYATKTDLLRHINVVHLRILLYTCPTCGERFPTSDSLRYHRVKFHEKPSFYCQGCGKCYKRIGELNTHIKRAHNERRKAEVCQYCSKEYYDRSGLRNHLVNKHNIPQEMTYSEIYLRKKRVDGLPLAKHIEKRILVEPKVVTTIQPSSTILQQQLEGLTQQHLSQQMEQLPHDQRQQHILSHQQQQHPHMRVGVVDEAAEAARNLNAYQEMAATEEEGALVITEITESPQVEQTVLVDHIAVSQGIMQHPQVAHMQPPMTMHHHMHNPMQHHPNMRLNVLYQMNMHHPGPSHINM